MKKWALMQSDDPTQPLDRDRVIPSPANRREGYFSTPDPTLPEQSRSRPQPEPGRSLLYTALGTALLALLISLIALGGGDDLQGVEVEGRQCFVHTPAEAEHALLYCETTIPEGEA